MTTINHGSITAHKLKGICLLGLVLVLWVAGLKEGSCAGYSRQFVLYSNAGNIGDSSENLNLHFDNLTASDRSKLSGLRLRAKVSVKKENRREMWNAVVLKREPNNLSSFSNTVVFSAPIDLAGSRAREVPGYDELWVDYTAPSSHTPVDMRIQFVLPPSGFAGKTGTPVTAVAEQLVLKPAWEIDAAHELWVPKKKAYSFARLLRLAPDEKWRYLSMGAVSVVQRRLHRNLSGIMALDFVFGAHVEVSNIHLRIGTTDDYSSGTMIMLDQLSPVEGANYGDRVYRAYVPQLLASHFPGRQQAYVQEVIAFVQGAVSNVRPPLKRVLFQAPATGSSAKVVSLLPWPSNGRREAMLILPARTEKVSSSIKRMIVDLKGLKRRDPAAFIGAKVTALIGNGVLKGAEIIKTMRLVRLQNLSAPIFLSAGEQLIRSWGGPFILSSGSKAGIEWPDISIYLPFEMLAQHLSRPGNSRTRLTLGDVSLSSDKPFRARLSDGALSIDGVGARLELFFPVSVTVYEDSVFFVAADYSGAQVRNNVLTIGYESGSVVSLHAAPNEPLHIPAKGRIKYLKLTITAVRSPFHIRLGEVAMFRPRILAPREAFFRQLPLKICGRPIFPQELPIEKFSGVKSPRMMSADAVLKNWPVLSSGKSAVAGFAINAGLRQKVLTDPVWIESEAGVLEKLSVHRANIAVSQNPWFELNSLAMDIDLSFPQGVVAKLFNKPVGSKRGVFLLSLAGAAALFAILRWSVVWGGGQRCAYSEVLNLRMSIVYDRVLAGLDKIFSPGLRTPRGLLIFWGAGTVLLYTFGVWKQEAVTENYLYTAGSLTAVMFLKYCGVASFTFIQKHLPLIAVFDKLYFLGAILTLSLAAVFVVLQVRPVAEQLAIVAYNCLVFGVIKEIFSGYAVKSAVDDRRENC